MSSGSVKIFFHLYFGKMLGRGLSGRKPRVRAAWQSFLGAFAGMLLLSALERFYSGGGADVLLIGSFGASTCMIFGLPESPYSQPRNVIGGHVSSALCGVSAAMLVGDIPWLACALAVSCALALMHLTRTFHPPGGATALIAVIGGPALVHLGYGYVLMPVAAGAGLLVLLGMLLNNFFRHRRYPLYWF
ncbi:MAG: HPP family protein [Desulfovibrionaceae bacterium]